MRILVTGGAGFIGSNFILYWLEKYPESSLINLDKLTYAGNLENLSEVQSHPGYEFVNGDVCDAPLVGRLVSGVDAVVHFAAETHVDRSIADARAFVRTNVEGTYTLIEAARRAKVGRFLHVSTDEVYGSLEPEASADEAAPLRPSSPYAASKAAADLLVRSYWLTYRFPAVTVRASNNYGPRQFPEKLIPLMLTNALEGKRLPVYGDGKNQRDWLYVEDHARALDAVIHAGIPGEVYNVGAGRPVTNLDVVRKLLKLLGKGEEWVEFVQDRPGHDRRYALDTHKIERELGWRPQVGLDAGLARTVEWYRAHADWVRKVKSGEYAAYYEKFYVHRRASLTEI